ncbi:hypothetical protein ROHU_006083 [Labeo rohita]|uniref:Uncharacterized protein n=1 Tax=Labeo rohita TaxID=84645 RepID=A0A498N6R5_LABRO|nr:hypothetical protein ROHU_013766 [Labeo rohita]RXN24595.1 hypothetical protein ROHU_006083 [Labeo rohita]
MPSPRSHSRAVNIRTPHLYHSIPAPRCRLPPPATKRQPCPAVPMESLKLTEDLRNMNISSSSHERPPFTAQYSDLPQLKDPDYYPYSLPRQLPEFIVPTQDQRRPAHAEYSSDHLLPSSTQEKIYRGPAPTIPCLTSFNPREFSKLRIALWNILPDDVSNPHRPSETGGGPLGGGLLQQFQVSIH